MKSRLLIRLEADIGRALTYVDADCLRCERAAYLARSGDLQLAAREVAAVQRRHSRDPNAATSAWSSFAEAMVCHAIARDRLAIDKMKRSHALSRAAGLMPLQALSAAWLAHFAWLRMDVAAMSASVIEAMSAARPDDHAARARANLVIAQGYDRAGRQDLARSWYASARYHTTQEGDDAMHSALMGVMAALRVESLQQDASSTGEVDAGAGEQALMSVESSAHFDQMLGMRGALAAHSILRARVCSLLGRSGEALVLYDQHIKSLSKRGSRPADGNLLADRAWCLFLAGRETEARSDAMQSEACLSSPDVADVSTLDRRIGPESPTRAASAEAQALPLDARAAAHGRLVQLHDALGNRAAAYRHETLATSAWDDHRRDQARMLESLDLAFAAATA